MIKCLSKFLPGVLALLLLLAPALHAQETSSAISGVVTNAAGEPLANSTVVVSNEKGFTRTVQTDSSGRYHVRNLPVGGGYSVFASSSGHAGKKAEGLSINLGRTANIDFRLSAGAVEVVEVIGTAGSAAYEVALGPSTTYTLEDLQNSPAINRNITDVIRADPRLYVDESRGDINAVQCAGKNSRFNSLTVDGVRMNDSFGLNSNGYPTERMPFSFDAINQVAVELAPFDVEYGGFSACNINAVTKSGGNEFSGSVFYDYTSDDLRADKLEGDKIQSGDYSEDRYGITFGGPLIKDKLFFFLAYEKLEGANLFDRGPIGSGAVNEINVTQAELDEIADIARTLYLYEPGGSPASLDHGDEKLLAKVDWNINDQQRLAFTYNFNDGENFTESDGANNEFEFSNHLYERGAELNSYAATLYSDWNPNFSTEVRAAYLELDNRQISVGGTDFGEIRVELDDVDVYLGGDDSRQSNKLNYDVTTLALKGNYYLDNGHLLTFGVEREMLEVFNLFVQHTETEVRFDGIDNFRNGLASAIYYNNAPSNNPADAAAVWGYDINTVYLQDEFNPLDKLTLVAGVRYDWYTTDDAPGENPDFVADYGFSNSTNLDGEGLVQPRLGFTYDATDRTVIRGGVGVYSGGDPNVWLSNNFSANNILQVGTRGRRYCYTARARPAPGVDCDAIGHRSLFDPDVVYAGLEATAPPGAGPGWGIPQELFNDVATGVGDNFEINYLDPNFELPSELKFALGVTHELPNDYTVTADLLVTEGEDSAIVLHGDLERVGTNPDGYPIYDSVRDASFVLTNSSKGNRSKTLSLSLSKEIPDLGLDWALGYTYNDAEDVQPMTSSVAFSNYQNRAFFDPQEDVRSTSNYNIAHRVTFSGNWRKPFAGGKYLLTTSLYAASNTGRPYSVAYNGTADPYGFTPFLDNRDNVLLPGVRRNEEHGSKWRKIDVRFNLDFPGFTDDHRASAFLVIDNLSNLLDDDWGVLYQHNFPRTVTEGTPESRIGDASRYEIRFGVGYEF